MSATTNPTLFPTVETADVISPVFPVSDGILVPEGFKGNQSISILSLNDGGSPDSITGTIGVGTPTAPLTTQPVNAPDASFPPPPVTPAGTLNGTPGTPGTVPWVSGGTFNLGQYVVSVGLVYINITGANTSTAPASDATNWLALAFAYTPDFDSAATLPVYAGGTTYALFAVVGYSIAISAWASGTTYGARALVSYTVPGGATYVYRSKKASNTANIPQANSTGNYTARASAWWTPIAVTADVNNSGQYFVGFMSLAGSNVGNTPTATSAHWFSVREEDARIADTGGPVTYPPFAYPSGTEVETWATSTGFGGTGTSTVGRSDYNAGFVFNAGTVATISSNHLTLSFSHTTTGTATITIKDAAGTTLTADTGVVPNITVVSSDPTKGTVAVVQSTGVVTVTGVLAGSTTITVACGGRSLTIVVTLS